MSNTCYTGLQASQKKTSRPSLLQNIKCITKFRPQSQACEYLTEPSCVYLTTQSHPIFFMLPASPRVQERKHPYNGNQYSFHNAPYTNPRAEDST